MLSEFECPKDTDLEDFIKEKSIRFNQSDKCKTFLIVDEEKIYTSTEAFRILGYFSLLTKTIKLPDNISGTKRKELDGMDKHAESIECFLIGQLAKNSLYESEITGKMILERAINMIKQAQSIIGKRAVLVECSDNPKVMKFYTDNGFKHIGHNDENNLEQMIHKLNR